VEACDNAQVKITAKCATAQVEAWRRRQRGQPDVAQADNSRPQFTKELFVDYITEWIPLRVIENPQLRNIFLLLHSELHEKDIPGRTTIRTRVGENAVGSISFTMDMWTDPFLLPLSCIKMV
ncbi:uncharacterized protein PHACADRAFT_108185, partial [Phanerochaete carnosa HHB-10118-sp]